MKKMIFILALLFLLPFTTAQEELEIEDAGVTPDWALGWYFDKMFERLELRLARVEDRNEIRLKHAEERMAEMSVMIEEKQLRFAEKAREEYELTVEGIQEEEMPEAVKTRVLQRLQTHVTVLQRVRTQNIEQSCDAGCGGITEDDYTIGIDQALQVSQRNIERFQNQNKK